MKKIALLFILAIGFSSIFAQNTPVLMSDTENETVISFSVNDFTYHSVQTPNGEEFIIETNNGSSLLIAGAPDLQKLTASIIIPDVGSSEIEVITSDYYDIQNVSIAPSKGNLTRDIDPASVAYTYGDAYQTDDFFPKKLASINTPYIMRDLRGQAVNVYPFQYNPVTKTLRVYTKITVAVKHNNNAGVNELSRANSFDVVTHEFNQVYLNHFINYANNSRYTPVEEEGNMLVICYDDWTDEMQDFVDWKNTIGRSCEMVTVTDAGGTASAIATYVENYYNDNGLTYLLLVGDATQVPTNSGGGLGGDSDNAYAYILGSDHYLDFFVGRFSAESAADVETQVQRTLTYENGSTLSNDWLNISMGVTSDQGPGDDNEMDYEHYRNLANDLLAYTYTESRELFDGSQGGNDASDSPTAAMVGAEIEEGVGIINYTGHGSDFSWASSGYSVSDINNLTNDNMLPFIWSVACVNGNFVGQTCFGEAWLRASNGDEPTGAIAIMASTINQSWAPPMAAQDEMVDILVESYTDNIKRSFAGLAINGCHLMNDETSDFAMTDTWTCFGDPSLLVRTDDPADMIITHDDVIIIGASTFNVNSDFDGALATLSMNGQIIGSAYVSGGIANVPVSDVNPGDELTLAVIGFNKVTYLTDLMVIAPSGPYIVVTDANIAGVQTLDYASTGNIDITLTNVGPEIANAVNVTVTTTNEYVSSLTNNVNIDFGNITGDNGTSVSSGDFTVTLANNVPDQHIITFNILITDENDSTWNSEFSITANAPVLQANVGGINDAANGIAFASSAITTIDMNTFYSYDIAISELVGNNNGNLDPGENVILSINGTNIGHAGIFNTYGHLTTTSTDVTINNPETFVEALPVNETFVSDFNIEVSPDATIGSSVDFTFIIGNGQYNDTLEISISIGLQIEDFESGDFADYNWMMTDDADWTIDADAYEGSYSAKSGSITDNQSTGLSFTCDVTTAGDITFFSKVDSEGNYDYLRFYIDGTQQDEWSGEGNDWAENSYPVSVGTHTFKWTYEKDGSVSIGSNCGWVDFITFPAHSSAKKDRTITIDATTLPTWLTLTDNNDGTAVLSGTSPNMQQIDDVVLSATDGTNTVTQDFTVNVGNTAINSLQTTVSLYPNPTQDFVNISLGDYTNGTLTISDVNGRTVQSTTLNSSENTIDVSNLQAGVYFVKITSGTKTYQTKFIKK